jgi:hypothetical protein
VEELSTSLFEKVRPQPKSNSLSNYLLKEVQSGRGRGRIYVPEVISRVEAQVSTGLPIQFAAIAIAHKNPRLDVCYGRTKPDLAELGLLLHLEDICKGVEAYYEPGAEFTLLTEGSFYNQVGLFDVSSEEISLYEESVQQMADAISGRISLKPLQDVISNTEVFADIFEETRNSLHEADYAHLLKTMDMSLTPAQSINGITADEIARDYVALHRTKHKAGRNGGSLVYEYLKENLGNNYIYSSVTSSSRLEVFNIDPYLKPGPLPQHGIGTVPGGSYKIQPIRADQIPSFIEQYDVKAIRMSGDSEQPTPFGLIRMRRKR